MSSLSSSAFPSHFASSASIDSMDPNSHSPQHAYLRSRFQIGSIKGRSDFTPSERVFHSSEIPLKAREARQFVKSFLQSHILENSPNASASSQSPSNAHSHRPWDSSGVSQWNFRGSKTSGSQAAWDTQQQKFDDRYFNRIESDEAVRQAKQRVLMAKSQSMEPKWNDSTSVSRLDEETEKGKLAVLNRLSKKLPEYEKRSLIQREQEYLEYKRAEKRLENDVRQLAEDEKALWESWRRNEHWSDIPPNGPQKGKSIDYHAIGEMVQKEFSSDQLKRFIAEYEQNGGTNQSQQNQEEKMHPGSLSATARLGSTAGLSSTIPASTKQFSISKLLARSGAVEFEGSLSPGKGRETSPSRVPAWKRAEAKDWRRLSRHSLGEFPIYRHPGDWSLESRKWSCCGTDREDSRGCFIERFDAQKQRVIIGDSEKSTKALGLEWSIGRAMERPKSSERRAENERLNSLSVSSAFKRLNAVDRVERKMKFIFGGEETLRGDSDEGLNGSRSFAQRVYEPAASRLGASGPGVAIVKRLYHPGVFGKIENTRQKQKKSPSDSSSAPVAADSDVVADDSDSDCDLVGWSCCLREDANNPGCETKTVTREDRWNVE